MTEFRRASPLAFALLAFVGFASACAPATTAGPGAPSPPPEPLTEAGIEIVSALLEIEDRRENDVVTMEEAAASPEAGVRSRAALAALRLAAPESRLLVRRLLGDADTLVSATAAFGAGILADTAAVPWLTDLLGQGAVAPTVAAEAAEALGRIATDGSREVLSRFLLTADSSSRSLTPVIQAALTAYWRAGESAAEPFAYWLASSDSGIRWRAAYGLARARLPAAVRLLTPLLADPHPLPRTFALRALHRPLVAESGASPVEAERLIVPLLADSSYSVRIEAIRALATYAPLGLDSVMRLAASGASHERAAAIESIGQQGPRAASALGLLRNVAADPSNHAQIRSLAVAATAAVDPPTARAWLRTVADDPGWRVRVAAATAMAGLGDVAPADLAPFIRDGDPRVAAAALSALAEWEDPERLRPFRALLIEATEAGDPYIRAAALGALQPIADPTLFSTFLDAYQRALNDPQNDAQLAAIDAIADLREVGVPAPERAFFVRFARPGDHLVRQRAALRFGSAADAAWGAPLPVQTGRTAATYEAIARRWLAPAERREARPRVRIETALGDVDVVLFSDVAPLTVANFLILAEAGYFDRQEWPRVVPNFVVQGGDPLGDTSGGPGYSIRDEVNRERYLAGSVGMALSGPDTGGSQFFVTHSPQPHLDGIYSVFGEIVAGADVIERILPGDRIIRVAEIIEDTAL